MLKSYKFDFKQFRDSVDWRDWMVKHDVHYVFCTPEILSHHMELGRSLVIVDYNWMSWPQCGWAMNFEALRKILTYGSA